MGCGVSLGIVLGMFHASLRMDGFYDLGKRNPRLLIHLMLAVVVLVVAGFGYGLTGRRFHFLDRLVVVVAVLLHRRMGCYLMPAVVFRMFFHFKVSSFTQSFFLVFYEDDARQAAQVTVNGKKLG